MKKQVARETGTGTGRSFFNAQIQRLAACDFFPTIKAGITELIDSLMRVSNQDPERAQRIIDRALKTPKCPTPADLESIAEYLPTENPPRGCEKCEGTGMVYVTRKTRDSITHEITEMGAMDNCDCEFGEFRSRKDQERRKSA